jgi:hypothetical protein
MAEIVNNRDVLIMAAVPRFTPPTDRGMFLTPSTALFKVSSGGIGSPASILFKATLLNMSGTVAWSWSDGLAPSVSVNELTLTYANFSAVSGTITAQVTVDGVLYTQVATVTKVADGSSGSTTYTWVKYADSATGAGLSDDPTGKTYIGLAYNKGTPIESTAPGDYAWSLIRGADGISVKGDKGDTLYTWVKYSDNPDGTGLYDTPTASTMYLGLAVNKTMATESTVKSDYVWSKFRGADGVGMPGARGNVDISAVTSSSVWSEAEAVAALAAAGYGAPQVRDLVNLYKSDRTFAVQKMYTGSTWIAVDYVWNGNVFVKGSILPEAIDTRGLAIRDAQGNVILGSGVSLPAAYAAPGTKNSELAFGGNLCYNSDFSNKLAGWTKLFDENSCNFDVSSAAAPKMAGLDWTLNRGLGEGTNTLQVNQPNTNQGRAFELQGDPIPVAAGKRYCISAYTGAHRCAVDVYATMYFADGTYAGAIGANVDLNNEAATGGTTLAGYKRHQQCGTIPDGVAYLRITFIKHTTKAGFSDSWMMLCRAQVEEVAASAISAGPWSSPGAGRAVYSDVATAIARVEAVAADGVLDRGEKSLLVTEWAVEDAVIAKLNASSVALGVDATAYNNAHNAASSYLLAMTPRWNDTSQDTAIDRATYRTIFKDLYAARAALEAALTAKAATAPSIDVSNLVKKFSFEDGTSGGWGSGAETAVNGGNAALVPAKGQLVTNSRDKLENGNSFPVTPGETLSFSAWISAQDTPYNCYFGAFIYNKDGTVVQYIKGASRAATEWWAYCEGSAVVAAGGVRAVPWLQQDGGDFNGKGYLRATNMWIGRHARGATVGAIWGGNIAGQPRNDQVLNELQQWAQIIGSGKPQDNATLGAIIGQNLGGQFTAANISTYIASAAIDLALINKASIANLAALSAVIGLLRSATTGQRYELSDQGYQWFNAQNVPVIQIGNF